MNVNAANNNSIIRLPSVNDGQRQLLNRGPESSDNDLVDRRQTRQESTEYVFRGEVLQSIDSDKRYKPSFNQQVNPQNRAAISNYQSASAAEINAQPLGRVIDIFI
ncbi:MAG: hypothetical protein ACI9KN_000683 [Gammaproteobacteria bacterium]